MKKAVILVSGGLDSATVLAIAQAAGYTCYAVSFDYGQHHSAELEAARQVAARAKVEEHRIVSIDLISERIVENTVSEIAAMGVADCALYITPSRQTVAVG